MIPTTGASLQSGIRTCREQSSRRITRQQDRRPAIPLLRPVDPSLTLTRTHHPAILSNHGNRKPFTYAGFARPCKALQRLTDHS
jgi:hypothetical protein